VDGKEGTITAIEVKATRPASKANRSLSDAQKKVKLLLESREQWKARLEKYVLYGEPGKDSTVKRVPPPKITDTV